MTDTESSVPITNIILPLRIEALTAGPIAGEITFGADFQKQYYTNAQMSFRAPDAAMLEMKRLPVLAALRRRDGVWYEIYDQDERFQRIGQVIEQPSWILGTEKDRLLTATIVARLDLHFFQYVSKVRRRYEKTHDVVLELSGQTFVQEGYPKVEGGITEYGPVDFVLTEFDAIYIVPKGGPSSLRLLARCG